MGDIPVNFFWFVAIGTVVIVSLILAFIGIIILNNRSLKEEKDFTLSILQNSTGLILVLDENGIIRNFNKALEMISGYLSKDVVGEKISLCKLFINPETVKTLKQGIESTQKHITTELITKENDIKQISWSCNFYTKADQSKKWIIWTGNDITELIQTQAELERINQNLEIMVEERTEELDALISQSPLAILVFDTDGELISSNKIFNNFFPDERAFLEQSYSFNLFEKPFLTRSNFIQNIIKLLDGKNKIPFDDINVPEEINYFKFKQNIKWINMIFYPVINKSKKIFRMICLIDDITKQKTSSQVIHNYELQKLRTSTMLETIEMERKRISQDLHDGIGQLLTGIKLKLETLEYITDISHPLLTESQDLLMRAGNELRMIIRDLHPQELEKFGLISSIENLLSRTFNNTRIEVNYDTRFNGTLSETQSITIYRIIQEAVTNIAKHSKCTRCSVKIMGNETKLDISIEDNGIGFDINAVNSKGHGLNNFNQRAQLINGKCEINSQIGKGTFININIPLGTKNE